MDTIYSTGCCFKLCINVNRFPALVTAALLILGEKLPDTIDSSSFYGEPQVIT